MNANRTAKVSTISEIKEKLQRAKALVVVEYKGLTVANLQSLRKQLKKENVELQVYKNRLFRRATDELGFAKLANSLTGQNAFVFGFGDDIAPAKLLAKYIGENEKLKFKAGVFEAKVVDGDELARIAKLPSYEEALTILASQMMGALRYVSIGLDLLTKGNVLPN